MGDEVFQHAEIAQLVEHNLAKVGVAGPSPVFRSSLKYCNSGRRKPRDEGKQFLMPRWRNW